MSRRWATRCRAEQVIGSKMAVASNTEARFRHCCLYQEKASLAPFPERDMSWPMAATVSADGRAESEPLSAALSLSLPATRIVVVQSGIAALCLSSSYLPIPMGETLPTLGRVLQVCSPTNLVGSVAT